MVYDSLLGIDPTFLSALQRIPAIPDESAGEWGAKMGVRVVFSTPDRVSWHSCRYPKPVRLLTAAPISSSVRPKNSLRYQGITLS